MPAILAETYPVEPKRKLWTRSECEALDASGAWDQQHLELVEGVNRQDGQETPACIALTISEGGWTRCLVKSM